MFFSFRVFFFFKQKTAYEVMPSLVGSEMCIRDRPGSARQPDQPDVGAASGGRSCRAGPPGSGTRRGRGLRRLRAGGARVAGDPRRPARAARRPGPRHQCPGSRGVFPRTVHNRTVHNGRRNLMTDDTARLDALTAEIRPLNTAAMADARHRQDRLTKPRGSLGVLEDVSVQLAGLAGTCPPPMPEPTGVAVFAADHGVHAQGVSPWPQEVTGQMVANFLAGGAKA